VADLCARRARRSLCHCLAISARPRAIEPADTVVTRFQLDGPAPALGSGNEALSVPEGDDPTERWYSALRQVLQRWV
jgi:hypothetical protein